MINYCKYKKAIDKHLHDYKKLSKNTKGILKKAHAEVYRDAVREEKRRFKGKIAQQ